MCPIQSGRVGISLCGVLCLWFVLCMLICSFLLLLYGFYLYSCCVCGFWVMLVVGIVYEFGVFYG